LFLEVDTHPGTDDTDTRRCAMGTVKDEVRKLLDQLPDDVSFEDIQYHIYVRQKLEQGLNDVQDGRVLSQEEMQRRIARWLGE
jgi:hypothetical protein